VEAALGSTAPEVSEAPDTSLVLRIDGLHKNFGGIKALDNVSLTVRHGEVHGLLGQNGSGKSTLIKILSGFYDADGEPQIIIDGRRVTLPVGPDALRERRVSFVHQHLGLLPSLTVLENLLLLDLAIEDRWLMDWGAEARRARELFERYDLPLDPMSPLSRLSPVERAQLAIVRAFDQLRRSRAERARGLLVLDEPTPFLPAHDVETLFKLVREIVADGASVIFVSHDIDEVLKITDRATVLRDGKVAGVFETAAMTKAEVIRLIVGRHVDLETMRPPAKTLSQPSLSIAGLSGGAIGSFSVTLRPGEVVGLTGLIGSGYSNVIYMTFGATPAESGTLNIGRDRVDLSDMSPRRAIGMGCILIPGDRLAGTIPSLTVCDNVNQPVLARVSRAWALAQAALVQNASILANRFDVRPRDPMRLLGALSGGNQQKALLAKWFQTLPRLILLDEPTQGVDVGARAQVFEAIEVVVRSGAAVLCASSDYEQLTAICDRVLVFSHGAVTEDLAGDKINKSAIAQACYRAG
jgi:ribose transport system ATP-binding protein